MTWHIKFDALVMPMGPTQSSASPMWPMQLFIFLSLFLKPLYSNMTIAGGAKRGPKKAGGAKHKKAKGGSCAVTGGKKKKSSARSRTRSSKRASKRR
jgi:hypothetical protein